MSEIEWVEPPVPKNNRGKYDAIADELRTNPGRWARIVKQAKAKATGANFRGGRLKAFRPAEHFEFRQVRTDGGVDIYARYVGKDGAA